MAVKHKKKSSAPASSLSAEKKTSEIQQQEKKELDRWSRIKRVVENHVVPPLFLFFFTPIVQVLAQKANPSVPFQWDRYINKVQCHFSI